MDKKITIITPSYNRAHTLDRVFDSIVKQSFKAVKWIVMDDGSTDNTEEVIQKLKSRNIIEIEYYYHSNRKKFCTLLEGVFQYVDTEYFIIMDSDDEFYEESILISYSEIEKLKDVPEIASVVGNTLDSKGNLVGTEFPTSPLDCHIFEMRHKFIVKGGKQAIHKTAKFKALDYHTEYYCGKGYVPDDVWQNLFDKHYKSRFINKIFKIYHLDENDTYSLTTSRYKKSSSFGIKESYKTALNSYSNRWLAYPIVMTKKMIGYIYFGLNNENSIVSLFKDLKSEINKLLFVLLLPFTFIYFKMKPLKN